MSGRKTSGKNPQAKSGKTVVKTVRLSPAKTRKLEKDFRLTVKETRTDYLSKELDKYKNIQVAYDQKTFT
jgi:hypothetical protein